MDLCRLPPLAFGHLRLNTGLQLCVLLNLLGSACGATDAPRFASGDADAGTHSNITVLTEAAPGTPTPSATQQPAGAAASIEPTGATTESPEDPLNEETGSNSCTAPIVSALFPTSPAAAAAQTGSDGAILTRGAGRVRGRHELEAGHSTYGALYFEHRSFGFTIEDRVHLDGTLRILYEPNAPVSTYGAQTNLRVWKVYGDGNVFHTNLTMEKTDAQHLSYVVDYNAREQRAPRTGDLFEFEFGIFIAGNNADDPGAISGRTAYYSDTFRYRIGTAGLTAFNADDSGRLGPEPQAQVAGATTIPWLYAEPEMAFSQMVLNIQPEHVEAFLRGRRLFHTDFGSGEHSEPGNPTFTEQADKLGPLFSAHGCSDCHLHNGRGELPAAGQPLRTAVVKLYAPASLGDQLQAQEGEASVATAETRSFRFDDGTEYTLERPTLDISLHEAGTESLAPSVRVARQIPGMGLLEAIPEADILARADDNDCNHDGISGRAMPVADPLDATLTRLGRFGWKAEKVSVADQVADALTADMGVSSPLRPATAGENELNDDDFADLVTYTQLLALPARSNTADPAVEQGETLFASLGCPNCHVPQARTGGSHPLVELRDQDIAPYSDLLLHDMGPDLADDSGSPLASEWRTPPLWGLGSVATVSGHSRLLHDGRASSPIEAVMWHGGEAAFAREALRTLDADERNALQAFLYSL